MERLTRRDQRPCRVHCLEKAGEEELRRLARLYLSAWNRGCDEEDIEAKTEDIRADVKEAFRSGGVVLMATRGGLPVGCARIRKDRESSEHYWWEGVAVHPGARGLGVARGLFHRAVRYVRDHEGRLLRSETHEDNAASARLHERLGFRKVGAFDSPHDGDRKIAFALEVGGKYHD